MKFNSLKSQVATFGSECPTNPIITLLNALLQWADKVKYLGMYIVCNTALTDISSHVRQFYSRFNNVLSVIGKGSREMCTLHLNKVYCLPSLTYDCKTWTLNDQSINRVNAAWNNSFRYIFSGFWRESVKPLQYFCQTLPISYFIDQRKLLFLRKLAIYNNNFLLSLSRLVQNRFYAIDSVYGITTISASVGRIKSAV